MSSGDRHQIVIHVDAETFRDNAPGRCDIVDGRAFPRKRVATDIASWLPAPIADLTARLLLAEAV
jgi:hypothetical protein